MERSLALMNMKLNRVLTMIKTKSLKLVQSELKLTQTRSYGPQKLQRGLTPSTFTLVSVDHRSEYCHWRL